MILSYVSICLIYAQDTNFLTFPFTYIQVMLIRSCDLHHHEPPFLFAVILPLFCRRIPSRDLRLEDSETIDRFEVFSAHSPLTYCEEIRHDKVLGEVLDSRLDHIFRVRQRSNLKFQTKRRILFFERQMKATERKRKIVIYAKIISFLRQNAQMTSLCRRKDRFCTHWKVGWRYLSRLAIKCFSYCIPRVKSPDIDWITLSCMSSSVFSSSR